MGEMKQLRAANGRRAIEWVGVSDEPEQDLLFRATELGGECGEALNIVKKMARAPDVAGHMSEAEGVQKLADELADVVICVDRVAEVFSIDLWQAIVDKFNATSDRHALATKLVNFYD